MSQVSLLTILNISETLNEWSYIFPSLLTSSFCVVIHHEFKIFNMSLQHLGQKQPKCVVLLKNHRLWHQQLCGLVDALNTVFFLYIAISLIMSVSLICVSLYTLLWIAPPGGPLQIFKWSQLLFTAAFIAAIILYSSVILNEEVKKHF